MATPIAVVVVALGGDGTGTVGGMVVAQRTIADGHPTLTVGDAATAVLGRVVEDGTVGDGHRALKVFEGAAHAIGHVGGEAAIGDDHPAANICDAAAKQGRVVDEGAVDDGHLLGPFVEKATTEVESSWGERR